LEGPEMLYRRQTGGPIFGRAAFLPPDRLVIASTDGYVTAINEQTGALQWDFSTGFDLYQTPICQADQTYAVTRRNELFCVSSTDGTELWMAPRVEQVLACGKERVYVRGTGGRLEALDKHTGKRLASLDAPAYSVAYHNPLTDRIYLLTNDGGLLCLREIDAYYPAIYRPLPAPEEDRQAPTTSEQPSGDEPAVPATAPGDAGDIFGGDIFGEAPALDSEPAPESDTPADPPTDDGADEEEFDDPFDFG
jgi:hypothetical protein